MREKLLKPIRQKRQKKQRILTEPEAALLEEMCAERQAMACLLNFHPTATIKATRTSDLQSAGSELSQNSVNFRTDFAGWISILIFTTTTSPAHRIPRAPNLLLKANHYKILHLLFRASIFSRCTCKPAHFTSPPSEVSFLIN
ncbi:hypothetical protein PsorP6_001415 [Peronosclerospora sorghi]|uniref:Uncharacterized protein n=1 Tax=Peronosclerospora sorghi TaxID=230839 RepID=A0ACC0WV06_9STRA|nr:hypothetical protein PsorP6_001415 [Peronosclerospora sorghi]